MKPTTDQECGRFYAPPEPYDYQFCYRPRGHEGPCKFEPRRPAPGIVLAPPDTIPVDPREISVRLTGTELWMLFGEVIGKNIGLELQMADPGRREPWERLAAKLRRALAVLDDDGA